MCRIRPGQVARIENEMSFSTSFDESALDEIIRDIAQSDDRAVIRALNLTAADASLAGQAEINDKTDRPTPWTQRAVRYTLATQPEPVATVYLQANQARYLQFQIDGGQRTLKGFELKWRGVKVSGYLVPNGIAPIDSYGNVSYTSLVALFRDIESDKAGKRYFVGTPENSTRVAGVYQRTENGGLRLIFVQANAVRYQRRIDYVGAVERTAAARFRDNLIRSYRR
jgi:hypothetical protein